jgi:E3 SUMO-protein ligase PIAS1
VVIEADGEWHTADNKYASSGWRAKRPAAAKPATPVQPESKPAIAMGAPPLPAEVYVIESDEEDDDSRVKREISPHGSRRSISYQDRSSHDRMRGATQDVIDLTLSDDEASPAPLRAKRPANRDSSSPIPIPAKRARLSGDGRRTDDSSWLSPSNFNNRSSGGAW